jgi:hypothetical protein
VRYKMYKIIKPSTQQKCIIYSLHVSVTYGPSSGSSIHKIRSLKIANMDPY